ncbi:MAG: hypothetical protein P8Y02_06030, partial [Deinococcales bacterium]
MRYGELVQGYELRDFMVNPFESDEPRVAILIAAFVVYELCTVHPRPPLIVWLIVLALGLGWFGFVLKTLRFAQSGLAGDMRVGIVLRPLHG